MARNINILILSVPGFAEGYAGGSSKYEGCVFSPSAAAALQPLLRRTGRKAQDEAKEE